MVSKGPIGALNLEGVLSRRGGGKGLKLSSPFSNEKKDQD